MRVTTHSTIIPCNRWLKLPHQQHGNIASQSSLLQSSYSLHPLTQHVQPAHHHCLLSQATITYHVQCFPDTVHTLLEWVFRDYAMIQVPVQAAVWFVSGRERPARILRFSGVWSVHLGMFSHVIPRQLFLFLWRIFLSLSLCIMKISCP